MIKKSSNKYFHFIVTTLSVTAVLIVLTIFYIINTTFSMEEKSNYEKAFKWQMENKGVVGLTVNIASAYKQRMLEWRIAKKDVDTILLGSSTLMGIKEDMFKNHNVFNGATNSNILYYTIAVAKYHSKYSENIKNIIIGFDWALGLPYRPYKDIKHNPKIEKKKDTTLVEKIKDAVSYQRVKIVVLNLIDHLFADPITQYKCPTEDTIGTDQFFQTDIPKSCRGYRFDGSAIFPNRHMSQNEWIDALEKGLVKYQEQFNTNLGTIDLRYLNDFKEISKNLKKKGGKLIILIPPLIPNATITMEKRAKENYTKKLHKLLSFAKENNITIFDASKSEQFGCVNNDFLDSHHAFPSCYKKILTTLSF
ncbi:hypothetical protein C9926_02885 [Sulfurovum lithotrophicum]|nr:hypothetical protein C9926_02885 [Sulfurovum lithotrophicum]